MAAADLESQIQRLEAVATRLEQVALGAGKKKKGGADVVEMSEAAEEWCTFRKTEVEEFLKAIDGIPDYPFDKLSAKARAAYDNITDYIVKADSCKKPTPEELQKALAPTIEAIGYYDGLIYSRKKGMMDWQFQHKAMHAAMDTLIWVSMSPPSLPKPHAQSGVESVDFNVNKFLMKDKSDANKALSKTSKAMGKRQVELIKAHFATGITWMGQKNVLECEGAPAPAAKPAATEEKAEAKPKKAAAAPKEPKGDVADELSKGLAVTSALKKVKKSQKNKYKKDKVSGKVSSTVKKAKAKKKLPDPRKQKRGKTWFLEYYQEGLITINAELLPKLDSSYGVFISSSLNCQFLIPEGTKLKSIVIDGCKRVQVQSADVVSTVEMVNSQNCTLWLNGVTPALTVDKCDSPKIVIMPPCYNQEKMVEILTSNVTAGNVELPPKNEDDDGTVIPIVEQYYMRINKETEKATMEPMEHAG